MDFFQNLSFKERGNMVVGKALRVTINFYEKILAVITWNKKHSSKQVKPIVFILEKKFFGAPTFERFLSPFISERVQKIAVHFCVQGSSLHFQRREDQVNIANEKKI